MFSIFEKQKKMNLQATSFSQGPKPWTYFNFSSRWHPFAKIIINHNWWDISVLQNRNPSNTRKEKANKLFSSPFSTLHALLLVTNREVQNWSNWKQCKSNRNQERVLHKVLIHETQTLLKIHFLTYQIKGQFNETTLKLRCYDNRITHITASRFVNSDRNRYRINILLLQSQSLPHFYTMFKLDGLWAR